MKQIEYSTNSGKFIAGELLPCPFCGGEPKFHTIGNDYTKTRKAVIKCKNCMVKRTTAAITHDLEWCSRRAIEAWNKRWQNER